MWIRIENFRILDPDPYNNSYGSALHTNTLPVVYGRAKGVGSAGPLDAGVRTGVVGQLAVLDVGAVVIHLALQDGHTHACNSTGRC